MPKQLQPDDLVFPTNKAVEELPELRKLWRGVKIKKIENGVAEVHSTEVYHIHVSKLTTDEDAYDPIL